MSKILFTNSYFYRFDKKQWETAQPYPPLGTITVAAYIEQFGHEVILQDNNLEKDISAFEKKLNSNNPDYVVIYDDGFNYLTKMCLTTMREAAFEMIKLAKKTKAVVIVNSSDSTDHFESYLKEGADYIIHGEGEITLKELIDNLNADQIPNEVNGLSYKVDDTITKTLQRNVEKDLDIFPMAKWELVDVESYRKIWIDNHGFFSLNLQTTRGCPYKCNWCAKPIYGNRYNSRTPLHVINEIAYLTQKYDVNYFWMCDDIFGLKPGWVQQFNTLRKEKNLSFKYKIQSRADLMLTDNNLDALVESGADKIWIGAESGSQKILDAMDKGTKVEQIYEATRKLKERGAKIAFFLQFGYLGETMADIKSTIKMVLDLMPDEIGISVSYPLPGTKFYDKVKSQLLLKANWKDSDDLDLMFENTFKPIFYKTLHRYVHNRYRIKKGWLSIIESFKNPFVNVKNKMSDIVRMIYHIPLALLHSFLLKIYAKR